MHIKQLCLLTVCALLALSTSWCTDSDEPANDSGADTSGDASPDVGHDSGDPDAEHRDAGVLDGADGSNDADDSDGGDADDGGGSTDDSPLLAFPGAVGYGADAQGGRGGDVVYVTNLDDAGEGSLRAALEMSGPRTVVFRTSGTIPLDSTIEVNEPYLTIVGQTAPGGGVALRHSGVSGFGNPLLTIHTHDIVVRHLRFRRGPSAESECCGDNVGMREGSSDVVFDHCSLSWSTDELMGTWPASRVTIQWCMLTEALAIATHGEDGEIQSHSMGPLFGVESSDITIYRNLFANNTGRNPRMAPTAGGRFQLVNNVVHNTCYAVSFDSQNQEAPLNAVGNVISAGPDTCGRGRASIIISGLASVYVHDNITPYRGDGEEEWLATSEWLEDPPADPSFRAAEAHDMPEVPTVGSSEAVEAVLDGAGATLPARDAVDDRVVTQVRELGGAIIDDPSDVGGWPTLTVGAPYEDEDRDGMDDAWERDAGFDPTNADDRNGDRDGDGYTNLEEFLNGTRT